MFIISSLLCILTLHFLLLREYVIFQAHHYELDKYLLEVKTTKRYYVFLYGLFAILLVKNEILFIIYILFSWAFLMKK